MDGLYDDFFYDQTCSIYSIVQVAINNTEKKSKTILYSNIGCSLWSLSSNNMDSWPTGRQIDWATHKINLDWQYSWIKKGYLIDIWEISYIVLDLVWYNDIDWTLDNTSLYVRVSV